MSQTSSSAMTAEQAFARYHAGWEARDPAVRAADAIDWRRLRTEVLEPLIAGQPARWHAFDYK